MPGVGLARLSKELKMLTDEPPPGVCAWPVGDCITHIQAQIQGPEDTPYERGTFLLDLQIPDRYPFEPPKVRFVTPIYHPNIDSGGRICLDTLKMRPAGSWAPSMNVPTLLTTIRLLMAHPNGDDGLMPDITELFLKNPSRFADVARAHVEEHARQDSKSTASRKGEDRGASTTSATAAAANDWKVSGSAPSTATEATASVRAAATGDESRKCSSSRDGGKEHGSTGRPPATVAAAAAAGPVGAESGDITEGSRVSPPPQSVSNKRDASGTATTDLHEGNGKNAVTAGSAEGASGGSGSNGTDGDGDGDARNSGSNGKGDRSDGFDDHESGGASSDDGAWSDSDEDGEDGGGVTSAKRSRTT